MTENNIIIDYKNAMDNNVRADAEKAIKLLLSDDSNISFTVFPQALNPILKALESLGSWKNIVIIPTEDSNKKPMYLINKVESNSKVVSFSVVKE